MHELPTLELAQFQPLMQNMCISTLSITPYSAKDDYEHSWALKSALSTLTAEKIAFNTQVSNFLSHLSALDYVT